MGEPLVELRDATLGYGGRPVLAAITATIARGDFVAVVGPNGSGKTTLLRAIAGILPARSGQVIRRPAVVGYVPQERDLDPVYPLSAMDVALQGRVARLGPWRRPAVADHQLARDALGRAGAEPLAKVPFHELSGGQKQRVLIARALASEPDLLVLDEPTLGTDPASERSIMDLLGRLHAAEGLTIVFATHDLALAGNYAKRLALVDRERRVFRVAPGAEILTDEVLSGLYGRAMRVVVVDGWRTILVGGAPC